MPVRLVLTEVAAWEVLAAVAGLVAGIWLLRRTAGRVFRLGMLMYGKEPTWREIWRWARESG
jgi:ABC-2 type transport system permease protein